MKQWNNFNLFLKYKCAINLQSFFKEMIMSELKKCMSLKKKSNNIFICCFGSFVSIFIMTGFAESVILTWTSGDTNFFFYYRFY